MLKFKTLFATLLLVGLAIFSFSCDGKGEVESGGSVTYNINGADYGPCPKNNLHPKTSILCRVGSVTNRSTVTPKGAKVWIEEGASVDEKALNAIDAGLQKSFDKATCKGYGTVDSPAKKHNEYTVVILKAEATGQDGVPAYKWPCKQYCGSEFDMGGYVLVAGQIAAAGTPYGNIIVLPESKGNYEYTTNGSEYETEHVLLAYYDGMLYNQTKTHGAGSGHPIWSCTASLKAPKVVEAKTPSITDEVLEVIK